MKKFFKRIYFYLVFIIFKIVFLPEKSVKV